MKKPRNWADALQQTIAERDVSPFTPEHKSYEEIRQDLKRAGVPHTVRGTYSMLNKMIADGRAIVVTGSILKHGRRVRCTKYLLTP